MGKSYVKGMDPEQGAELRAVLDPRDPGALCFPHTHPLSSGGACSFSDPELEVAPEALPLL